MTTKTVSAGTATLDYDYENRLVKITYPVSGSTEFVYDALGRRLKGIEKDQYGATIGERHYVYDGLDLIAELDGDDEVVAAYTHGPGIDDPLIVRYNGNDYFYQTNHQGSVTELLNAGGYLTKSYKYEAFGNIISETGPAFNRGFTYTSRERHARSGFYYYRARFYDPQIGRFLTQDPIGDLGGVNLYAYVGNSPVVLIDPLGYWGFGATVGETTDVGLYAIGAGQTGSAGFGIFASGLFKNVNAGLLGTWGGFAGGPLGDGYGLACPSKYIQSKKNFSLGAFGGGGLNLFITNASDKSQLKDPMRTYTFSAGWHVRALAIQFSKDEKGTWVLSYGGPLPELPVTGVGYGISYSVYNTNTWVTK